MAMSTRKAERVEARPINLLSNGERQPAPSTTRVPDKGGFRNGEPYTALTERTKEELLNRAIESNLDVRSTINKVL
jgi:hypothetical protein